MKSYAHHAARLYETPLMIHPGKAEVIERVLRARIDGLEPPDPAGLAQYRQDLEARSRDYRLTEGGTAVIPITGTLIHRGDAMDAMSGLLSYRRIARRLADAIADPDARGILLDLDTPGGEVGGLFDLADALRAAAQEKPLWACADECAYSAGYAIACTASRIVLSRTAGVGSVGVVALHVDQSKRDASQGYAYEYIYAGEQKIDGHPHAPLGDGPRSRLQAEVDRLYGLFVAHVAACRGLSEEAVRATQAGLFHGQSAVDARLADAIGTIDSAVASLEATYPTAPAGAYFPRGNHMTQHTTAPAADPQPEAIITQADLDAAQELGAEAERSRIFAIIDSEAAADHPQAALALARNPAIAAAAAGTILASLPPEVSTPESVAAPSAFEQHMAAIGNPRVGIDDAPDPQAEIGALWGQVAARYAN